ncbi:MAG: histidine kinase [Clostridiales bacterium]|nr:histidine kinase [Clostridiales bacterium]
MMQGFSIRSANIALEAYSILICVILILYYLCHMDGYRRQKQWLVALLVSNVCMMLGDLTDWFCNGVPGKMEGLLFRAGLCCFFACTGIIIFNLVKYLICLLNLDTVVSRRIERLATAVTALQVACSVLSLWNGMYYQVMENNVYVRGPYFPLAQILPAILFVLCVILLWSGRRKLTTRSMLFLFSCILLPAIGQLLQVLFYGGAYVNAMATIALLLLNINVQSEQDQMVRKTEKELTVLQVEIMLSQIQPHFLYNALTAIRQLCDTDPKQAKESILDFSRFLRANMNSLTTNKLISFDQELEHARSYLNLEQQRFGERLHVIYNINAHDFMVPTLTLQPIVENAVRHGIRRKEEGGTVKIYTEEWRDGYVVIVSDDGVGMEIAATFWEDSNHIGIANVRRRIEARCGGSIMIKSSSEGTVVTMWFPKHG